jgi:hypothetical protein
MLNSGKDTPLRGAVERSGTIVTTQFCPAYIKYAGYDFREGKGALGVKRAAKRSGERRESGSCTMCVRPISITNQIHRRRAVSAPAGQTVGAAVGAPAPPCRPESPAW